MNFEFGCKVGRYQETDRFEELMILEVFQDKGDPELRIYLANKGVTTPPDIAIYADDYYFRRKESLRVY